MIEFAHKTLQLFCTKYAAVMIIIFWVLLITYLVVIYSKKISCLTVIGSIASVSIFAYGLIWLELAHLIKKEYKIMGIVICSVPVVAYCILCHVKNIWNCRNRRN